MKKVITLILVLCLVSCDKKELDCTGQAEQETLKKILYEESLKSSDLFEYNDLKNYEDELMNFFMNIVKLEWVVISDKNDDLNKCDCSGKLTFRLEKDVNDFFMANQDIINEPYNKILLNKGEGLPIDYSLQGLAGKNNSDEFIVSTNGNSDLPFIAASYMIVKKYYKQAKEEKKSIKTETQSQTETQSKKETKFYVEEVDISDPSYNNCYVYSEDKSEEYGENMYVLKYNIEGNQISGQYYFSSSYADGSYFGGDVKGTIEGSRIDAIWYEEGEGMMSEIPIIIEIDDDNVTLAYKEEVKFTILNKVDCGNIIQLVRYMEY